MSIPPGPQDPNDPYAGPASGSQPPYGSTPPSYGSQPGQGGPSMGDGYSAPPPPPGYYGGDGGYGSTPPPPNHLVWAILTTVLCCLPLGVVSIVFSTQVNTKWAQGDQAGAQVASQRAKTWAIASAVVGLVFAIGYIALVTSGVVAGLDTTGY
ncbi:CD225/dispanin family protein [Actinotalea sp. AC32]|nr:CD225/dispanin family protein [Actinotalea sp. AC32]